MHVDDAIIGRTSGKPGIPLSRRVDTPDGGFGGMVIATLSPDYFEAFYRTVRLHDQGTVALWREDGSILARKPPLPGAQRLPASPVEEARLAFSANTGLVRSASPFEHVAGNPLVASAAVSVKDALAEWKRQALVEGSAVAAASLCLILLGRVLVRCRLGLADVEDTGRHANRGARQILDPSSASVTPVHTTGWRPFVSPASRDLLGHGR